MAENEAPTMTAPGSTPTAAFAQAAPATYPESYPASAPTAAQATYPAAAPTVAQRVPAAPNAWAAGPAATPVATPAAPPVNAPAAPVIVPAATPVDFPAAAPPPAPVPGMPATGVPANAVPSGPAPQEELFGGGRNDPPRQVFLNRLRTPLVAAVAGGVLMLGAGFGAGFVVGRDNPSSAATTGVQDATGIPGGGTGFGNGRGRQGFGGPMGQPGADEQVQPGTGGQAQPGTDGTTGTTDSTGLAQSQ
jgi:hypothetical protein